MANKTYCPGLATASNFFVGSALWKKRKGLSCVLSHGGCRSTVFLYLGTHTPTWRHFIELVELRFGPPLWTNSLGKLVSLHCGGKVEDYQEQFLAILCRPDPLTEHQIDRVLHHGVAGAVAHRH